jgi:hypothetical protein
MSAGISDRFVQRGLQGRIIVIVCETGIDAELFIVRQFVHRGEDVLHGAHDRRLQNKWSRSNMSIRCPPWRASRLETIGAWHKRLYNTSKSACIISRL